MIKKKVKHSGCGLPKMNTSRISNANKSEYFLLRLGLNWPILLSVLCREGAPRLGRENQLRVGRDTELYRILNMHYNKSNIYQVRRSVSVCSMSILLYNSINFLVGCFALLSYKMKARGFYFLWIESLVSD